MTLRIEKLVGINFGAGFIEECGTDLEADLLPETEGSSQWCI
jgi:hypothetical protein